MAQDALCLGGLLQLILDDTVVKVLLNPQGDLISQLMVLGVRHDGQKLVLAIHHMGGECWVG